MEKDIKEILAWYKDYHRLSNYVSAAMLYLQDNYFLEQELKAEHIKSRILGHWGTVPGLNFIYGGIYHLINKYQREIGIIAGPGHGAPSVLTNLFFEQTITEFYKDYTFDSNGLKKLIKTFSWPGGFPSHTYPGVPGSILEGGELGYSLGTAFGAVMDNPDAFIVAVVGDGEAETGPLAAAWHSNKFINPARDGVVLPILHLNGYRISGPTIFGTMSQKEIDNYFKGLGYDPVFVDQYTSDDIYIDFLQTLISTYQKIEDIKNNWNTYEVEKPKWPVIILKTKKGWSCPEFMGDKRLEDNHLSHGIPIQNPKKNDLEFQTLKKWLESYNINELLKNEFPTKNLLEILPEKELRTGKVKILQGGENRIALKLPNLADHALRVFKRGARQEGEMEILGRYLREIYRENNNFRVFSPDESESNKLEEIFDVTDRAYIWPVRKQDEFLTPEGKVMEILSEHVLTEWMEGYVLTGRHGVLISYEAFLNIVSSMMDQYLKYLKQSSEFKFRKPIASLNFIATSTTWRQDHNGFTHQNPTLINSLLAKESDNVNIYFPSDVNTMLVTMDKTLRDTNCINLIVSDKREIPQWLTMNEAMLHVEEGISTWEWVDSKGNNNPDVVLSSSGDHQTQETLAAAHILKEDMPNINLRYVNINNIKKLQMDDFSLEKYFTDNREIIFNFHGYPSVIKQLTWNSKLAQRLTVIGYSEKGTTTTPFDMQVLNGTSRYHICIKAIQIASKYNPFVEAKKSELLQKYESLLNKHSSYIKKYGDDMPEVKNQQYNF